MTVDVNMLRHAEAEAIEHAIEVFPHESVGFVRGGSYNRLTNAAKKPEEEFVLVPEEEAKAFAGGLEAIIHSHPNGLNTPTTTDMIYQQRSAVPWCIIVLRKSRDVTKKQVFSESFWFGDSLPIAPYIGRQFKHGVFDCYTLYRDWWRKERGVVLPNPPRDDGWWFTGQSMFDDYFKEWCFVPVVEKSVQPGDAVLMSIGQRFDRPKVNHMGIYIGNGKMLHHCANRLSKEAPVSMWHNHVVGYARSGGK